MQSVYWLLSFMSNSLFQITNLLNNFPTIIALYYLYCNLVSDKIADRYCPVSFDLYFMNESEMYVSLFIIC